MAGVIARLAGHLYAIGADGQRSRMQFGLDAKNKLVFDNVLGADSTFHYIELFDGDETKLRFSLRTPGGRFHYYADKQQIALAMLRSFQTARLPSGPGLSCVLRWTLSQTGMFNADGSLNVFTNYASAYAGDAFPGDDADISGYFSLKQLSNPSPSDRFERAVFATNAPVAISPDAYPLLARMLGRTAGVAFKDVKQIPFKTDGKYKQPRAIGLRPVGIRRKGPDGDNDFLTFGGRVQVEPTGAGPGSVNIVVDSRNASRVAVEIAKPVDFHLIPDVFNQPDLDDPKKVDSALHSYVAMTSLSPHLFADLWNERVAQPYLSALRTVDDARETSFVPLLQNIGNSKGESGEFDALFDMVQPDARSDDVGDIVLAAVRPTQAAAVFIADAVFPGLVTHDGLPVRRRVKVRIEREAIKDTFCWFDTSPASSSIPEIKVEIVAEADAGKEPSSSLRFGALDLDVPGHAEAQAGPLEMALAVTFDPADPALPHYATAKRDPKGKAGRARLPYPGEAIPRIVARIDRFDLADVRPGAQDAPPDSGRAFDAVLEPLRRRDADTSDPEFSKVAREKRIANNLSRDVPLVLVDRQKAASEKESLRTPFFLTGEEVTATGSNRRLALALRRKPLSKDTSTGEVKSGDRTIVIDAEPLTVAMANVPTFGLDLAQSEDSDGEIANWETSEFGGGKWEIAGVTAGFNLSFPPQATGEAFEKGVPWPPISPTGAEITVDYRLGTLSRLSLQSSYFKQQYAEAPWNLRRVLGSAGDRAPGAGMATARFEFLYGLASRLTSSGLRLAEIGARIGGLRTPLPARPKGIVRSPTGTNRQPLVEAELYDRQRDLAAGFSKVYETRLAQFGIYREGTEGPLSVDDKVAFELRANAEVDPDPWDPQSQSNNLGGGATRGFESKTIFQEVMRKPASTRGQIIEPSFTALGGSGFMRAFFANGKTRIVSNTVVGRTDTYTLERIGRIGVFWNIAKHVIVYERTVLPPDQFAEEQDGQHLGRPVVRKVQEYVELLEPDRAYPEKSGGQKARGFVEACLFRTRRIPVKSSWGRDIEAGWIVPLWRSDADRNLFPKPDIRLRLSSANTGASAAVLSRLSDPSQLVFFTSVREEDGDLPDQWLPVADVDFVNAPAPSPTGRPVIDRADPDGRQPDERMRDPMFDRGTFDVDSGSAPTNLIAARASGEPIGAVVETVSMMRSKPTGAGGGPAQAIALRAHLQTMADDARVLEARLNEAISTARGIVAGLWSASAAGDPVEAAIARLDALKGEVRQRAAAARQTIGEAASEAKAALDAARSKWTDEAVSFQSKETKAIEETVSLRLDALIKALGELQADPYLFEGTTPNNAENVARQIEQALALPRSQLLTGINRLSAGFEQLDRGVAELLRGMSDAARTVADAAADVEGTVASLPDAGQVLSAYDAFHRRTMGIIEGVLDNARRGLPPVLMNEKIFPVGPDHVSLSVLLGALRAALDEVHSTAFSEVQKAEANLSGVRAAVGEALRQAVHVIEAAGSAMTALNTPVDGYRQQAAASLGAFTTGLDDVCRDWLVVLYEICRKPADDLRSHVQSELRKLTDQAVALKPAISAATKSTMNDLGGLLDGVGRSMADEEKAIGDVIDGAAVAATTTITGLEVGLIQAIDAGISVIRRDGGAIKEAAEKLEDGAKAIANGLRQQIPPSVAENIRALEEGYKRLSNAPSFQNPSDTLALVRAAGASPILPNLSFNRDRIAYFFDDARDAIRTSPVVALMNRLDDDLKALGIRLPTDEILDRFTPKGLENFDFSQIFPDLAGLKLDGLFKNFHLPAFASDKIKVSHGFDKASLSGWAKAEASTSLGDRSEIFEFGPLNLSMVSGTFAALADFAIDPQGLSKRTTKAEITGDWELAFSGHPLVTLEETRIFFEDGKGLDVDIDPRRVRLDNSIKFLSDLIKSFSDPNSGFFLEMLEENGVPAGISARIELPLPPLSFGAFSATGMRFATSFELVTSKKDGGRAGEFALATSMALGRKSEPFVLRVWVFLGGGWFEARARYFPTSGKLSSAVSIGLTAGVGMDFAFGPCSGFVYAMLGAYAEFETDGSGGKNFSIAVIFLVRGGVVILGRFNIGLSMLLELVYRDDGSAVARGTLEVSFKICWCCEIKVRQAITYYLSGAQKNAAAASGDHLDNFA
ncbi:hypothetical protein [Rhizobium sp. Root708]|uniref:hypothetical protein n=1 Tax=Rhizobium sp. Root708 TaxID=1736592 RepID=UPI0006FB6BA1|nr:hypothetical protein [Rhizobium sp. Root708]